MMELFVVAFGALFSIMNPLSTVPMFVGLTHGHTKAERVNIAIKTAVNVIVILVISYFLGKYILVFFGVSLNSLKIAGGLIIATSGFALLTGKFTEHKGMKKSKAITDAETREDIALTPLAIPMIAGPGAISLLITYNQESTGLQYNLVIMGAIVLAGILIFLMLRSSSAIVKVLGASGINALSRIIGFIVIAIGIEFVITAGLDVIKLIE